MLLNIFFNNYAYDLILFSKYKYMKAVYIFSLKNFSIVHNNKSYIVSSNNYLKLVDFENNTLQVFNSKNKSECFVIDLNNINSTNHYRVFKTSKTIFIELISAEVINTYKILNTKNCQIFIKTNSLHVVYDDIVYPYYFCLDNDTNAIEFESNIYIFNKKCLILFNLTSKSFSYFECIDFNKNDKSIEIIVKFLKNNEFFIHFSFNLNKNMVSIKNLKNKNELLLNKYNLPYYAFNLIKHGFVNAKNLFCSSVDINALHSYLCRYDNIVELDDKFYIYNHNSITVINFIFEDNLIKEID